MTPNGANFVDLHVYIGGAAAIDHPGTLYNYVYADQTPDFPLPFTYPPFAAVVFYPLHLLPFGLVALCWQVGTMAALYGVVRVSQRLLGVAAGEGHRVAMLWTAVAIWIEPLRSTFDYGQVNVLLVLAGLYAVYTTRWWLSGLLVGTAAGVKLTPAITGLYFVGVRRWGAAVFSAVVFLGTVAVSALVVGDQVRYYFIDLLRDTKRVGPIGTSFNQSWRGDLPDRRPRRRLRPAGAGRDRRHRVAGCPCLARAEQRPARSAAGGRVVRPVALADFLDPSLGVVGALDDLADPWPAVRASRCPRPRVGLAGAHPYRCPVVAQLRAADHLAERPAVVSGLGRAGVHRRDAGDPGLDRNNRTPD